jgi:hypothetical protein
VILGFIVFPLAWSVPEALITAELATAFPENSGYVAWVSAAFGPFWGFQEGAQPARRRRRRQRRRKPQPGSIAPPHNRDPAGAPAPLP